jgi:hypothetical protein
MLWEVEISALSRCGSGALQFLVEKFTVHLAEP